MSYLCCVVVHFACFASFCKLVDFMSNKKHYIWFLEQCMFFFVNLCTLGAPEWIFGEIEAEIINSKVMIFVTGLGQQICIILNACAPPDLQTFRRPWESRNQFSHCSLKMSLFKTGFITTSLRKDSQKWIYHIAQYYILKLLKR